MQFCIIRITRIIQQIVCIMKLEPGHYYIQDFYHWTIPTISMFIMERYVDIICRYIVMWCWSYSTVITDQHSLLHLHNGWCNLAHALASAQWVDRIALALRIHATVMPPCITAIPRSERSSSRSKWPFEFERCWLVLAVIPAHSWQCDSIYN